MHSLSGGQMSFKTVNGNLKIRNRKKIIRCYVKALCQPHITRHDKTNPTRKYFVGLRLKCGGLRLYATLNFVGPCEWSNNARYMLQGLIITPDEKLKMWNLWNRTKSHNLKKMYYAHLRVSRPSAHHTLHDTTS